MAKQRISYVAPESVADPAMRAEFERCRREGTPRPESQAIRAHVPACFMSFANTWRDVFHNGVCDHAIKELCRVYDLLRIADRSFAVRGQRRNGTGALPPGKNT